MKSRILASRQAVSSSSCVTSDPGLQAPMRMLSLIVPEYKVYGTSTKHANESTQNTNWFLGD